MILGIGTDIAHIDRIADVLSAHGGRFSARCFAQEERARIESQDASKHAASFAKCWAAKEACAKALGTGIRDDVFLRDIVLVQEDSGRPGLLLRGGAKARLDALTPQGRVPRAHVSISDEPPMVVAFVVLSAEAT